MRILFKIKCCVVVYKVQLNCSLHIVACWCSTQDPEDLPFKKDEILTIIRHDEEQWWTARNAAGSTGLVPVNYLEKVGSNISLGLDNYFENVSNRVDI